MADNNYPLAVQTPTTFTNPSGVLIGDYVSQATATPAGSWQNTPSPTLVSTVPVSAVLELQSTTGAFLLPRMTTTQRNALVTVVNGMQIYNSTLNATQVYQGGSWTTVSSTTSYATATVALSSAQLKAMYAAPITVIAAPGANLAVVIDRVTVEYVYVATAYAADAGSIVLEYGAAANGAGPVASGSIALTGLTDQVVSTMSGATGALTGVARTALVNTAISISNTTAALATGDGTAIVNIWYSVVTV